jgi:hypothetical protein
MSTSWGKLNAAAVAAIAAIFAVLALTRVGEIWQPEPSVRDVYLWIAMFALILTAVLVRAEARRIPSVDRWMAAVWLMTGFAVVGFSPLWPVLLLSVLLGSIVRLEARMAFEKADDLAQTISSLRIG